MPNFFEFHTFQFPVDKKKKKQRSQKQQQQQVGAAVQCLIYVKSTKINFEKTKNETNSAKT